MNFEEIKTKLEKEREELKMMLKDYEEETEEFLKEPVSASDEIADRYEYIEEAHLRKEVLEERLKKIEKAIKKIEKGNYGFCEKCSQKIEETRLKIDPAAELCRSCALTPRIHMD
jgi:DnaK suppressor protein